MALNTFPIDSNQGNSVIYRFSVDSTTPSLTVGSTDATISSGGTGQYTLTFNRAFAANDYSFTAQAQGDELKVNNVVKAVGSVTYEVTDNSGTLTDDDVDILVLGSLTTPARL